MMSRPVTPVGILAAKLESLSQKIGALETVDTELKSELHHAWELAAGLDPYISSCITPESPALATLVQRTQTEDWGQRSANNETLKPLEQENVNSTDLNGFNLLLSKDPIPLNPF